MYSNKEEMPVEKVPFSCQENFNTLKYNFFSSFSELFSVQPMNCETPGSDVSCKNFIVTYSF